MAKRANFRYDGGQQVSVARFRAAGETGSR